jgi:hypothetical protein
MVTMQGVINKMNSMPAVTVKEEVPTASPIAEEIHQEDQPIEERLEATAPNDTIDPEVEQDSNEADVETNETDVKGQPTD